MNLDKVLSQVEATAFSPISTGKRTFLISKEFAFYQDCRKRGAIDFHQPSIASATVFMYGTRNEFLASTRLSKHQHRRYRIGHLLDQAQAMSDPVTLADDFIKAMRQLDCLTQIDVFCFKPRCRATRETAIVI
jgi:hypothetical protein